jgi:hypothetical protein
MKPKYSNQTWIRNNREKIIDYKIANNEQRHFEMRVKFKKYLRGNLSLKKLIESLTEEEINYYVDIIFDTWFFKIEKNNLHFLCLKWFFIYLETIGKFTWSPLLLSGDEKIFFKTLFSLNPKLKQSTFTRIIYNMNG